MSRYDINLPSFVPLSSVIFQPYKSNESPAIVSIPSQSQQPIQINASDTTQTKCYKIFEINQNLKYNISLLQSELQLMKKISKDKQQQSKKLNNKIKQKQQKQQALKRTIKAQQLSLQTMITGHKNLNQQINVLQLKQTKTRDQRINAQQDKNKLYEQYNKEQGIYKQLLAKISGKYQIQKLLQQAHITNQHLKGEIAQLQDCLNQQKQTRQSTQQIRKQRTNKIKQLNQKIMALQKQQSNLIKQTQTIERERLLWQSQQQKIQQKSAQAIQIYRKLQQAKSNLVSRRIQFSEIDSTYKQYCIQENRLKKQILLRKQCEEQRKRYKDGMKKKVTINKQKQRQNNTQNHRQDSTDYMQSQRFAKQQHSFNKSTQKTNNMDNLLSKFEKIKSKRY